ncbi:hypothetical protein DL768_003091 [Monosporascus sp. mg162]|nr:hypothetical protein DL768_003091 [Monosporascus sp. mg162]
MHRRVRLRGGSDSCDGAVSIRILILEPSPTQHAPIRCSFREISLARHGPAELPYESLSYTWGVPRGTRPVLCDGMTILVTPNCEQALLHLRRKFTSRNIWIDAICINQQSVSEKNHQRDPDLSGVLRRAGRYGGLANRIRRLYRTVRRDTGGRICEPASAWNILNKRESERIARLCTNDWFSRMWTIQELLLSKSSVFHLGNTQCLARDLLTFYALGYDIVWRDDLEHYRMRNSLSKLGALNNTTDGRDKVYGILSYLKSQCPEFQLPEVDYAKPLEEVYEMFTRALISRTNDLWAVELVNPPAAGSSVPSWVLDLRSPNMVATDWRGTWSHRRGSDMRGSYNLAAIRISRDSYVSRQEMNKEERDRQRTTCLSEWTAFYVSLDLQPDFVERSPYRSLESSRSKQKPLVNSASASEYRHDQGPSVVSKLERDDQGVVTRSTH